MPSHEDYLDSLLKNVTSNQGGVPEASAPESLLSDEELPEGLLSDEVLPEGLLSDEVLPESMLSDEVLPEGLLSDEVLPESMLSDEVLPEGLLTDEELPESMLSDEVLPENMLSDEALPEGLLTDEELPEGLLTDEVLPESMLSDEELPEGLLSDEELPESMLSNEVLPESLLSDEELPEGMSSDEVLSEGTLLDEKLPEGILAADFPPEDIISDEMLPESVLSEDIIPEDIIPEDIVPEDVLTDNGLLNDIISDDIAADTALEMNGTVEGTEEELAKTMSELEADLGIDQHLDDNGLPIQERDSALDEDALLEEAVADLTDVLGTMEDLGIEEMEVPEADLADIFSDIMEAEEGIEKEASTDLSAAPDLESVSTMSEEEIERFLAASADELGQEVAADDAADKLSLDEDGLLGMLEGTDDSDLMDIQSMLDKADNNEAVNEEIEALLNGTAISEQSEETGVTEIEDERSKRAREKKQQRQEKAAARKAAKEAKAAAKAAAKGSKQDNISRSDDLFDSDLLDAIVSEADQAGRPDEDYISGNSGDSDFRLEDTGTDGDVEGEASGASDEDDDMGFNMDSLFGDVDDSGLGNGPVSETDGDSAFPDFVDFDGKSVDAIMPELEETGSKKKGLLARLFEMLTEEDEEKESESLHLSDENRDILDDLDKEKEAKKKKKKKGKKAAPQGDEEDDEEGKGKAKKAKKVKKPKPEKPQKEPEPEPLIPEKKLTLKKVMPILLVCASLGVLIIVFANASVDYTDKKNARDAYYEGDYQTCYENLFGKELSETEQIMFGTSKSILYMRLWMSEYEMFVEAGEEIEALDNLLQTVSNYPKLYDYAVQWNAGDEVMAGYAVILNILSEKYGLSEEQAKEIAAVRSDYRYTEMVVAIVQGKPYGSWDAPASVQPDPDLAPSPLPDELPEEGELEEGSFISSL